MVNTMAMDTSFSIMGKSVKANLQMVKRTDKQLYGMRTEVNLQVSLEMVSMCTEKRLLKMEIVTKVSLKTKNFMEKGK